MSAAASIKFKSLWYSIFQTQNTVFIQKSIKHVDKYNTPNDEQNTRAKRTFSSSNKNSQSSSSSSSNSSSNRSSTISATATTAAVVGTVATNSPQTNDYRIKREKNNESVRKSRAKNRVKLQECVTRVQELRTENGQLNKQLNCLEDELFTLKNLFQHCFSFNLNNLAIKPSDIPTSTLYKMIMQNKTKFMSSQINEQQLQQQQTPSLSASALLNETLLQSTTPTQQSLAVNTSNMATRKQIYDDTDFFYINQIKNALINLVKYDVDDQQTQSQQQIELFNNHLHKIKLIYRI